MALAYRMGEGAGPPERPVTAVEGPTAAATIVTTIVWYSGAARHQLNYRRHPPLSYCLL